MSGNNTKKKLPIAGFAVRSSVVCGVFFATVLGAEAQTRRQPDTTDLTCEQTHELVARFGAINLKSGRFRFDRYVSSGNLCLPQRQAVTTTYVPTRDSSSCPVKICVEPGQGRSE